MKVRVQGTMKEIDAAVEQLRQDFVVLGVSKPYKDRSSTSYRVYVDAELPAAPESCIPEERVKF